MTAARIQPPRISETSILHAVLIAVSALPETLVYRNNVGVARTATGAVVRFSLPGSADIMGVHRGRAIAIETKTKTGRLSPQQQRFRTAWERAGGLYIVARSADDALAALGETQ